MAINFPSPATPNQTHTHNGLTWKYDGTTWILQTTMQSGATSFVNLTDTPSSYSGQAGKWLKVNSTPDGLEFTDEPTGTDTTYDLITSSSGNNVVLTLDASAGDDDPITITAGNNITLTENGSGTGFTINSTASGGSGPSTEEIQDIVGAMFSNNTETRIAATYQDGDGTIDLVVDDMTSTGSDTTYDFYCSGSSNPVLRLDPSSGSNDDVTIKGGTDITVTRNSNTELEIAYSGSGGSSNPGGSDHDIQYNNNGSMGGAARLHYHDGDNTLDFLHSDGTQKGRYYVTSGGEHAIWSGTSSPNSYSQGVAQLFKSDGIWFPAKMYSYESPTNPQNSGSLGEPMCSGGPVAWDYIPNFISTYHCNVRVYGPGSHTYTPDLSKWQYFIIILTGGGGSGGDGTSNAGGGGGGAGGTVIQAGGQTMLGANASASISVGSGGSGSSGMGNNGSQSTVSTNGGGTYYMTAGGGEGGIGNQANRNGGGAGGSASCSNSISVNAPGSFGYVGHTYADLRGAGGPSFWGGPSSSNFSVNTGAPGSGGTGSQSGGTSQPGVGGVCVIIEI